MSGGVDSSVAAYLLQQAGWTVGGATIRTWASGDCEEKNTKTCCGVVGVEDAQDVAWKLDIRYYVFNFEKEFKTHVVDYFAREYMNGRTPNPCIACNEHIKFKLFLDRARELGYEYMATGHYARLVQNEKTRQWTIEQGLDHNKDQSYVLFPLSQDVLSHLELPIGGHSKSDIRAIARKLNLGVADKPDSQEICFIPSNNYGAFLENQFEKGEITPPLHASKREGEIQDQSGKVLGKHQGYYHFTIGQRKGLHFTHSNALYVIHIVPSENLVVVGPKDAVLSRHCTVEQMNWFVPIHEIKQGLVEAKIRSKHQKAPAYLEAFSKNSASLRFNEAQDAITPGQACVIYRGEAVLGGGWIAGSSQAVDTPKQTRQMRAPSLV